MPLALEAMMTEHEADRTTYEMMDQAVTQSAILVGDILQYMIELFSGIRVFPDRMRRNLDLSGGLIMSEALMLELGRRIGRQRAHDAIYDAAQASVVEVRPFTEMLAGVGDVRENLTAEQIKALLDPTKYIGASRLLAERFSARAREVAGELESVGD